MPASALSDLEFRSLCKLVPVLLCHCARLNGLLHTNRSNGINLFHYCLNEHLDDIGSKDRPVKITALRPPSSLVWLFDNGKKAARAQQNNVHTNVHSKGANISFVDGHVSWHRSSTYWDFQRDKGLTNNPEMVWNPER